jgi:ATP-binding cassette, sub-family E, member 1
LFFFF